MTLVEEDKESGASEPSYQETSNWIRKKRERERERKRGTTDVIDLIRDA